MQKSDLFRTGRIYGMDVNSGAAVAVLLSTKYDVSDSKTSKDDGSTIISKESTKTDCFRILDLCCAPGLKLCTLADMMACLERIPKDVRIVGVDVSESRLAVCKRIITKYHVHPETAGSKATATRTSIQLYCGDGATFGTRCQDLALQFDSSVEAEGFDSSNKQKRKRKNKSARARESKRLRQLASEEMVYKSYEGQQAPQPSRTSVDPSGVVIQQFDRVLVDAECSTDGSLKHVIKRSSKPGLSSKNDHAGAPTTNLPSLTDRHELSKLVQLQRELIESGFRLLKSNGFMVYSTCSLSEDQNELIVSWLLEKFPNEAHLVPVKFQVQNDGDGVGSLISEGSLPGTVRFQPNPQAFELQPAESLHLDFPRANLYGDGFFLAKIGKTSRQATT